MSERHVRELSEDGERIRGAGPWWELEYAIKPSP
ncbi:Protein of unknown function [Pyronema omphalodes CBS 100304]|uniref:Uncharacterized protein n=1 Tax=Pyronema omphalodes (strain CBS 100304) TaxID=1076935 RepID=U4LDH1_PYROM|nr:Protein of unknown function [Pyronema omphalodes CBS 100304]